MPTFLADIGRDLRLGARLARRGPGFTASAVMTLALAVGANVAVFTIVKAIWLEPRPIADPDRVVVVTMAGGGVDARDDVFAEQFDLLRGAPVFEEVAGQIVDHGFNGNAVPRLEFPEIKLPIETAAVTANYFRVLGLDVAGRDFRPQDEEAGAPAVAIIGADLWQSAFGGAEDLVGRTVQTANEPVQVVGIAPPGFRGVRLGEGIDVWIPRGSAGRFSSMAHMPDMKDLVGARSAVMPIARLRDGISLDDAEAALEGPSAFRDYDLVPIAQAVGMPGRVTTGLGDQPVMVLVGIMALVVLTAGCATLAALVLVHLERRRGELAVRLALGSSRARLARGILTEVLLLVAGGAVAALLLARWGLAAVRSLTLPGGLSIGRIDLSLDWQTAGLGLALSAGAMVVAALVGLMPSVRHGALTTWQHGGSTASAASLRLRRHLLSGHVAATVVVLIGSALFVRTVSFVLAEGSGFDADRVLFVTVQPSLGEFYDPPSGGRISDRDLNRAGYAALVSDIQALPNVRRVALGESLIRHDATGSFFVNAPVERMRTVYAEDFTDQLIVGSHQGGPGYAEALGLRLFAGTLADTRGGTVITRSLADRLWPNGVPLGERVRIDRAEHEIVGVVEDFVQGSVGSHNAYGLVWRVPTYDIDRVGVTGLHLVVGTASDAAPSVPLVEQVAARRFPRAAKVRVATGRRLLVEELGRERLGATFFSGFGAVSLTLGIVGVFGLVAYSIESRSRELGIRLALGATSPTLAWRLVAVSLLPVVIGTAEGVLAAVVLSGTVAAFVRGVGVLDVLSYTAAVSVMLGSALAAALLAAQRVRKLSPLDALRAE